MRKLLFFVITTISISKLDAQLSEGGTPASFKYETSLRSTSKIIQKQLSALNFIKLREEDEKDEAMGLPPRAGKAIPVSINLLKDGDWEELPSGKSICRLKIKSEDALALSLHFSKFIMGIGDKLFFYNLKKTKVYGAFSERNNKSSGVFATSFLSDDEIVLEFVSAKGKADAKSQIIIDRVINYYNFSFFDDDETEIGSAGCNNSGDCNVNINCAPGESWQNEKTGVALVGVVFSNGDIGFCSGSLINNTRNDGAPLFLTAQHCLCSANLDAVSNNKAEDWVFYWDFELLNCNDICDPNNLPEFNSTCGGVVIANDTPSDFSLFYLTEDPNCISNDYQLNGWKWTEVTDTIAGISIHHPAGDVKKISSSSQVSIIQNTLPWSGCSSTQLVATSHLLVDWENGVTEGGSSGSPMFDLASNIIGQVRGASYNGTTTPVPDRCDEADNFDYYFGALSYSWNNNNNSDVRRRLDNWLDPLNMGVMSHDGAVLSNCDSPNSTDIGIPFMISSPICQGDGTYDLSIAISAPFGPYIIDAGGVEHRFIIHSNSFILDLEVNFPALTGGPGDNNLPISIELENLCDNNINAQELVNPPICSLCELSIITPTGISTCSEIELTIDGNPFVEYEVGEIYNTNPTNNASPITMLGGSTSMVPYNNDGSGLVSFYAKDNTGTCEQIELEAYEINLNCNDVSIPTGTTPLKVISPVEGPVFTSTEGSCGGTYSAENWCFWQWGAATDDCESPFTHCVGGGIDDADDTYAWDANLADGPDADGLGDDKGKEVYAVADGERVLEGGWSGSSCNQLLIKHRLPNGNFWYSSYLHLETRIEKDCYRSGELIGTIGDACASNDHLHFTIYDRNSAGIYESKDAEIISNACQINFGEVTIAGRSDAPVPIVVHVEVPSQLSFNTSGNLTATNIKVGGVSLSSQEAINVAPNIYKIIINDLATGTFQNDENYDIELSLEGSGKVVNAFSPGIVTFVGNYDTAFPNDVAFDDQAAISYIDRGTRYGLFKGGGGYFNPAGNLLRGQAAKVIAEMAFKLGINGFDLNIGNVDIFPDVSRCYEFYHYIQTMANYGHINGYDDGEFKPEIPVTFGEFSKMLVNVLGLNSSQYATTTDVNHDGYEFQFESSAADLVSFMQILHEVIVFYDVDSEVPDGVGITYEPLIEHSIFNDQTSGNTVFIVDGDAPITRKDMAIVLSKAYERLSDLTTSLTKKRSSESRNNQLPELTEYTIIGSKLILPAIPEGNGVGTPIIGNQDIYIEENEILEWDGPDHDSEGNPLVYYWTIDGGTLERTNPPFDFSQTRFIPDDISVSKKYQLYNWIGNTKGKASQSFINILVQPVVGECFEDEPDEEAPIFLNCPIENYVFGIDPGSCNSFVEWSDPVADDNCQLESVNQIQGPVSGSNLAVGIYEVIYAAVDTAGNVTECSFNVEVVDTETLQWLNCPNTPLVFGTNPDICAVYANWPDPVATDNCEVTVTQTEGPVSGELLDVGEYTVTFEATNNATPPEVIECSFQVIVMETQNPELNCPQDITVSNDPTVCEAIVPNIQLEFAFDNCPYTVTWTSSPTDVTGTGTSTSDDASGAIFPVGITTVTYTITENDDNGNGIASSSCDLIVTVVDTEPPVITCPPDVTIGTSMGGVGDCEGEYTWNHPTPTDNCGVTVYELTYTNPDGSTEGPIDILGMEGDEISRIFELKTTTILYHTEDEEGNVTDCTWTVTVEDDEDPEIYCELVVANNVYSADVPVDIEPNDVTDVIIPVATDADITDVNILSLVGTQPDMADLEIQLISPGGTNVSLISGACVGTSDFDLGLDDEASDAIAIATCGPLGGGAVFNASNPLSAFAGERSVGDWILRFIYSAEAECGVLTDFQLEIVGNDVTVENNRLQVLADPGTCTFLLDTTQFDPPFSDNCEHAFIFHDLATAPSEFSLEGNTFPIGETEVLWVVQDTMGNRDSCILIIDVLDNQAPEFLNCPSNDFVQNAETGQCGAFVTFTSPIADDNCADVTVTQIDDTGLNSGSIFPVGMTILRWLAEDSSGNTTQCSLRVIVNDTQEPQFECGENIIENTDPWTCSAVVNGIGPVLVNDNCQDNISIVWQVEYPKGSGEITNGGVMNASGEIFFPGISEVQYRLSDHPLLLITEVTHEIGILNGGMDTEPFSVLTTNDYLEITNFGPATLDVSGLQVERIGNTVDEIFTIPDGTLVAVGEQIVVHFGNGADDPANLFFNLPCATDLSTLQATAYVMSFKGRVLDVVAVNGFDPTGLGSIASVSADHWAGSIESMNGKGGVIRRFSYDNNSAMDWYVADVCNPIFIGAKNAELDIIPDNGTIRAFQSLEPFVIACAFDVEVVDQELPYCGEYLEHTYTGASDLGMDSSIMGGIDIYASTITVADDFIVGEVEIIDVLGTHPDMSELTFKLTSPSGNQVILFEGLCPGESDFDFTLANDTLPSITMAGCNPLGQGGEYSPSNSLCTVNEGFYGENSLGDWILEIADTVALNDGQLDNWTLILHEILPYSQMDTTYQNDIGDCGALFTWVHPRIVDNCKEGNVRLKYVTEDNIEVPVSPGIIMQADTLTEFFEVGITTVRYILTDESGNIDSCEFQVEILDEENPFVICPADIGIGLEGGECRERVFYAPVLTSDNCAVVDTFYSIEPGTYFEIGVTPVFIVVYDPAGNTDTCFFNVEVVEYDPLSSEIACNNAINLSLDDDCEEEITADMILEGGNYHCYEDYIITLLYENGDTVETSPIITLEHENLTLTASILDPETGISCWGLINVEEKLIPEIECPADTSIFCNSDPNERDEFGVLLTGELRLLSCENNTIREYEDTFVDGGECGTPRATILREFILDDDEGNQVRCTQIIEILPYEESQIVWPEDKTIDKSLICYEVEDNPSLILPDSTGYPLINGVNVSNPGVFCNLSHSYEDEIFWICEGSYEILRTWKVRNRCLPFSSMNPVIHNQVIEVLDKDAPILYPCPDEIVISVDPWSCDGSTALPIPDKLKDLCSGFTFDVAIYGPGFISQTGSVEDGDLEIIASNINKGSTSLVRYTLTDACGNINICDFNITVVDHTPPVVVTKEFIVVDITSSASQTEGFAKMFAESMDNGSYDGCTDVRFEVRRDTDICNISGNLTYNNDGHPDDGSPNPSSPDYDGDEGAFVKFCCEDVTNAVVDVNGDGELDPGYLKVWIRVWDDGNNDGFFGNEGDNYAESWSFVKVEDKLAPVVSCPPDITIDCDADVTDFSEVGKATGYGSCGEAPVEYADIVTNLTDCKVGFIIRRWSVIGRSDIFCDQRITVDYIEVDENVSFSQVGDKEFTGCPDDIMIGEPMWVAGPCDLIGYTVETDTFFFEDGACYKLVNEWTVINWCKYDPNDSSSDGVWKHTQVIKVTDESIPQIRDCENNTFPVNDHNDADNDGNVCESRITLINSAFDEGSENCPTGWLKWQVIVDLWGDGTPDLEYSSYLPPFDNQWNDTNGNGIPDLYLSSSANDGEIEIVLPDIEGSMSNHKVTWHVSDGCGNNASCTTEFNILDQKPPTPYCVNISTALMEETGTVTLWASDLNLSSFDNCTNPEDLRFTFTDLNPEMDNQYDDSQRSSYKVYTCADIENAPIEQSIYVWDEKGNSDYCLVTIVLSDNSGYCENGGQKYDISGHIETATGVPLANVEVSLNNNILPEYPRVDYTENDGFYGFTDVLALNNYSVRPEYDVDYLNGVNTLDLVLIQRHILGLELLNNPYKVIAADINGDEKVQVSDLLMLRKLILGIITELPDNTSWKFVDAEQEFIDVNMPWSIEEDIDFIGLDNDEHGSDFVAVKIGDVNNTVITTLYKPVSSTRNTEFVGVENISMVEDQEYEIEFFASSSFSIYGFQMNLAFSELNFIDILPGKAKVKRDHYHLVNNELRISYSDNSGVSVSEGDVLFRVKVSSKRKAELEDLIEIKDNHMKSEIYSSDNLLVKNLALEYIEPPASFVWSNYPNPFRESTTIRFDSPEKDQVMLKVRNSSNQIILNKAIEVNQGVNEISISGRDLNISGVYTFELVFGEEIRYGKMIFIK